jgi:hypothetical protein
LAEEIEVELWSVDETAVEATRRTLEAIGGMLFERDGRWFIGTMNAGFIRFAVEQQGYVKRVIQDAD